MRLDNAAHANARPERWDAIWPCRNFEKKNFPGSDPRTRPSEQCRAKKEFSARSGTEGRGTDWHNKRIQAATLSRDSPTQLTTPDDVNITGAHNSTALRVECGY